MLYCRAMSSASSPELYLAHRRRRRSRARHFFSLLGMTLTFLMVSVIAIFYSLGYEVNLEAKSVQQTGSLMLDADSTDSASVYVNGQLAGTKLPFWSTHLFPGTYSLSLRKDGYQEWDRTVDVAANQVVSFRNLVLVKDKPDVVPAKDAWLVNTDEGVSKDIEVRSSDELWLDGVFLTRTSQDILSAQYYPGNNQIVYQAGKDLWLLEPQSMTTQLLLSISAPTPISYTFRENGRELVYRDPTDGKVKAVLLYDR